MTQRNRRWYHVPGGMPGRILSAAGTGLLLLALITAFAAPPAATAGSWARGGTVTAELAASAGDRPPGFWYGTDSRTMTIPGSGPYQEPVLGGAYGGYIGMLGNWSHREGCHGIVIWSSANSKKASADLLSYHKGIGTGGYWFMAGPGVDPHYNGTTAEASAWGRQQAAWALADAPYRHLNYPVLFMDIELPGNAPNYTPAPDNGWNSVYTRPCSGAVKASYIRPAVDRADLNGFAAYLTSHSSYRAGVYSAPGIWAEIFGTGSSSVLSNTYEWTYESFTSSLRHHPAGWCLSGTTTCARFFGGIGRSSRYALMWQWSGGGGSSNGYGDFDQIDGARTP